MTSITCVTQVHINVMHSPVYKVTASATSKIQKLMRCLANLQQNTILRVNTFQRICFVFLLMFAQAGFSQSTEVPSSPSNKPPANNSDIARLTKEYEQAEKAGDHEAQMRSLVPLAELTRNSPAWGLWQRRLMSVEFYFGSQARALELGEALIAKSDIQPTVRSRAASEIAWMYFEANQIPQGDRAYAQAERAFVDLPPDVSSDQRNTLQVRLLTAQAQKFWRHGNLEDSSRTLRDSLTHARRAEEAVARRTKSDLENSTYRNAVSLSSRSAGLLMYAVLRQGRIAEGLAIAQEWVARTKAEQLGPDLTALWQRRLASSLLRQRQFEEALAAVQGGFGEQQRLGAEDTSHMATIGRYEEIRALVGLRRWSEADSVYTQYRDSTRGDRIAFERASNAALEAILAAKNGRTDVALKRISGSLSYRTRVYGSNHYLTMESRGIRGVVQLINGATASALSDYEYLFSAILDTPSGWTDLNPTGVRGYYLEVALDEFLRYVAESYRAKGSSSIDARTLSRLIQVTDRVGSGVTQQAIIDATARLRSGNPELSQLLGTEQEIRGALQGIYREIAALLAEKIEKLPEEKRLRALTQIKELRASADKTQLQLSTARKELSDRFPAYRDLVTPVNPKPEALQKSLGTGEAFLSILPTHAGTFIWVVNSNGQQALHVSRWTTKEIDSRAATLRQSLDLSQTLPAGLGRFNFAAFHEMYKELIAPVTPALKGAHTIIAAAHGALATFPLATLLTTPSQDISTAAWLVHDYALTQVPGASSFVAQRRTKAGNRAANAFVAYADPDFGITRRAESRSTRTLLVGDTARQGASYSAEQGFRYQSIPQLPETRDEVIAIAKVLGADLQRDLFLGNQATRRNVLSGNISDRRVVAFATHGVLPGEIPGLSKPALAMANTSDPSESPLLDLDDVLTLKLNAEWVLLSACNTAGAEAGGQAMSGLVRGFFFAGGRSVLATHWAVETDSATALVTEIFSAYVRNSKQSRASSLRDAQLALIQGKIGTGKYAHPFFWSPYALFGDPAQ